MAKEFFDKDNYIGVNERISQFRADHPQGLINTFLEKSASCEYFKAVVFRNLEEAKLYPPIAAAAGHSEVTDGGKKSLEKAETVAIGRALAILGYEVKKGLASAEEMEQFNEREARDSKDSGSRFARKEAGDAKEDVAAKGASRFNRAVEEKEEEPKKEAEPEEKPKSRFAGKDDAREEAKEAAPAAKSASRFSKKDDAEEDSESTEEDVEDSEDKKTKLRSSRPFKNGSRFTRGA